MEPKEEQDNELLALEAIFPDEFRILEPASDSDGSRFEIDVVDDTSGTVQLKLIFTHTTKYPEEPIAIVVHALEGLTTPNRKKLQTFLVHKAKENAEICMPAAFNLCEDAKQWLRDHVVGEPEIDEQLELEQAKQFETIDSSLEEKVEVVSSKAVGTPVTPESFLEWQATFLAEKEAEKTKERLAMESNRKMTGRQLFESKTVVVSADSESFWEAEASQLASGS